MDEKMDVSLPWSHIGDQIKQLDRIVPTYERDDQSFVISDKSYQHQYSEIYFKRLTALRPVLLARLDDLYPDGCGLVDRILRLEEGQCATVVGTLFKDMPLRPSVLAEYAKEKAILPLPKLASYVSEEDTLVLEDESGRVRLIGGKLDKNNLVTGIIAAVVGTTKENGELEVSEIIFPDLAPQAPWPTLEDDVYVAFVSCLRIGNETSNGLPIQLLGDFLTGFIGTPEGTPARIGMLVVAGNTFARLKDVEGADKVSTTWKKKKDIGSSAHATSEVDMFLSELVTCLSVDLMPGFEDPTNFNIPQQPLNPLLLHKSSAFSTLRAVTNPHQFSLNGVSLLGTSGENVNDMKKCTAEGRPLALLEKLLMWRHLCPTAPDTLGCYPFSEKDPFVMESCPHILFVGGQPSAESKIVEGPTGQRVLLLCVPDFSATATMVLVNMRTLEVSTTVFGA